MKAVWLAVSLLLVPVGGCSRHQRLYVGPPRAPGEVAILECDEHVIVPSVDGKAVPNESLWFGFRAKVTSSAGNYEKAYCQLEVEPGVHEIDVALDQSPLLQRGVPLKVKLEAKAGRRYRVMAVFAQKHPVGLTRWSAEVVEVPE